MAQPAETRVPRRAPDVVMRLARLGSLHQSRLSFMRILTRRMARDGWTFERREFEIDSHGVGHAVYTATGPERAYSLICFAHDLPAELRSDRVIAEAWDATFTLHDGVPGRDDIERLRANVPLQEAGRVRESELSLSRANRSVRLWTHVVGALAEGRQPDREQIDAVGYLMRTTAVYGSGKFGAADRARIADRPELQVPFQAEMLSVYLTRTFVRDLINHMARARGGDRAVTLDPTLARRLGIGNSTGLGMAPFLINHPLLFNNWIMVREEALARVRSLPRASAADRAVFRDCLARATQAAGDWRSAHPMQQEKIAGLVADLSRLSDHLPAAGLDADAPWDALHLWAKVHLGLEAQELVNSLMLEPYGELVDGLASCMADPEGDAATRIDGAMRVAALRAILREVWGWALEIDWQSRDACARAWYVSEEKLEPRLGERFQEDIAPWEQPLAPGRDAAALFACLDDYAADAPVAELLLDHPEHRHVVRRAQLSRRAPYGEIRDNTISARLMPIDMLRAKLSFFGATDFDPRSDRWVRICMYAGAPYPEELAVRDADRWVYPALKGTAP